MSESVTDIRICGVSEAVLEQARKYQWQWANKRRLNWYIADRLPGLSLEVLTSAYAQAFAAWQAVCGLVFTQVFDKGKADFIIMSRRIDRPSGVLAEHQLPNGTDTPIGGWFDISESWTVSANPGNKIDLVAVATHEFGHGIGLSHLSQPNNLLNPMYNPRIRTPQSGDIAEAVGRYGGPVEEPKPPEVTPGVVIPESFLATFNNVPYLYVLKK